MKRSATLFAALLVLASALHATLIPDLVSVTPSAINPGAFTWTYTVSLAADQQLNSANPWAHFWTLYDFGGFVDVVGVPVPFTSSVQNSGIDAEDIGPPLGGGDDPGLENITFTWEGAGVVPGPDVFGLFQIDSVFAIPKIDFFEGQSSKLVPGDPSDNTRTGNIGRVEVPIFVPEPEILTIASLGSALVLLGRWRRRRV
jgi:hypothetical protein